MQELFLYSAYSRMDFKNYLPVNLHFGSGKTDLSGEFAASLGKKALIVTGRYSTKKTGLLDRVVSCLNKSSVETVIFNEIEPNPLTTAVMKGAALARESDCDMVMGLGGGSTMDAAKAIALMAVSEGDINDYVFARRTSEHALPLLLIPTTCGTGSEANGTSVLSNPETLDKKSIKGNMIIAKYSIVDPLLMKTMPRHVMAAVGFDALCHNMEAYLSKAGQPFSEIHSLKGMELVAKSLTRVYDDYEDDAAWEELTLGSTIGGMAIYMSSVTAPHSFEHPVSGLKNLVHGRGLAALTPVIYEETLPYASKKMAVISQILGGKDQYDCVDRIRAILEHINLSTTLSKEGIVREDIPWLVKNSRHVSISSLKNHPVEFDEEWIARIYEKAL